MFMSDFQIKRFISFLKMIFKRPSCLMPDKIWIKRAYFRKTGEKINLKNPVLYNEKMQWIKLYDRQPEYPKMVDKYEVRQYVSKIVGEEYLVPNYGVWNSFDEIPFESLPNQFVLKCTHDCGSVAICKDKTTFDIDTHRKRFKKYLSQNYFWRSREWVYRSLTPRIIAEKYLVDESGTELKDYKIYCFNGEPKVIGVYFSRFSGGKPKSNFYTPQWEYISLSTGLENDPEILFEKPKLLDKALELAKKLSAGILHVRVDLYIVKDNIYFGELTFYEDGGFIHFDPPEWNNIWGDWIMQPVRNTTHQTLFFSKRLKNKIKKANILKRETLALIPYLQPLQQCLNKKSPLYIVSLTSFGVRLTDTAPYAIISLLNQSVKPDKIILWVAHSDKQNIPTIMEKLVEKGLEINYCDDLKSYKKLVPTLLKFPDDYIITADDDIHYPQNWFEKIIEEHKKNPKKIVCHRAHIIEVNKNCLPLPSEQWNGCHSKRDSLQNEYALRASGAGGVLYPPKCLHKDVTNSDLFLKLAPKADDTWFWAMAIINKDYFGNNSPYSFVENGCSDDLLLCVDPLQTRGNNSLYHYNKRGGNDKQMKLVMDFYPQIFDYFNQHFS